MTDILVLSSDGQLTTVDHTLAVTALVCTSTGDLSEIFVSGTQTVVSLDSNGNLIEVTVTFGGGTDTPFIPTPTWTF